MLEELANTYNILWRRKILSKYLLMQLLVTCWIHAEALLVTWNPKMQLLCYPLQTIINNQEVLLVAFTDYSLSVMLSYSVTVSIFFNKHLALLTSIHITLTSTHSGLLNYFQFVCNTLTHLHTCLSVHSSIHPSILALI